MLIAWLAIAGAQERELVSTSVFCKGSLDGEEVLFRRSLSPPGAPVVPGRITATLQLTFGGRTWIHQARHPCEAGQPCVDDDLIQPVQTPFVATAKNATKPVAAGWEQTHEVDVTFARVDGKPWMPAMTTLDIHLTCTEKLLDKVE